MQTRAAIALDAERPLSRMLCVRPPRIVVAALSLAMIATMALIFAQQVRGGEGLVYANGVTMGGDYVVFWSAARGLAEPGAAALYDAARFDALIERVGPPKEGGYSFTFQYPPTFLLAIAPLALAPFGLGYALWSGGGLVLWLTAARLSGVRDVALLAAAAATPVMIAALTGQNGFLIAALFLGASLAPDKRPWLAGLCAALMTVKPQLGLLLPIAYAAGGHWRAFGWAAALSAIFALKATLAFGPEAWAAFLPAARDAGETIAAGGAGFHKLANPYGFAMSAGAPRAMAQALQALATVIAGAAVWRVWRADAGPALRVATLAPAAILAAPYVFFYDMVLLVAPMALLGAAALRARGQSIDGAILLALFLASAALPAWNGVAMGGPIAAACLAYALWAAKRGSPRDAPKRGAPETA